MHMYDRTILLALLIGVVGTIAAPRIGNAEGERGPSLRSTVIEIPGAPDDEAAPPNGIVRGAASPGLDIVPTFDASITNDPDAATIMSTINAAIAIYESTFCDPITVAIRFSEMGTGLGSSSTYYSTTSYTNYLTKLTADTTTADDTTALATLPGGAANPVNGNTDMAVKTANSRAIGINANPPAGEPDGYVGLNTSICNLDRNSIDPAKYDLMAVVMHEIDEVLSLGSALSPTNNGDPAPTDAVFGQDLFRYAGPGVRSFDTLLATQAFFSIDAGATNLVAYNQSTGGDFGDWFSTAAHTPRVQDAFATPGVTVDLGPAELTALDVLGYDLCAPQPTCGDGTLDQGETCDPPGGIPTTPAGNTNVCRQDCTYCGDGTPQTGESCDDGNDVNTDGCRNDCTIPECGDGIVDPLETCDPPGSMPTTPAGNTNACRSDCSYCGDSALDAGEACDDGNRDECDLIHPQKPVSGDSCNNICGGLICEDPARVTLRDDLDVFKVHGALVQFAGEAIAFDQGASMRLVAEGTPVFEASLPAGALRTRHGGGVRYRNPAAKIHGGIYRLVASPTRNGTYRVSIVAYGEVTRAATDMTTHIVVADRAWTIRAAWRQVGPSAWVFVGPK